MNSPSDKQLRNLWLAIGIAIVVAIWVLSLIPLPKDVAVPGGDKLHHFAAYCGCAFWWCAGLRSTRHRLIAAGLIALMGVGLEGLQGLTGWRHFEVADMVANGMGSVAGFIVAAWVPTPFVRQRADA